MENRCVLITGAAEGTGFHIAKRFAKDGVTVAVTSRDAERAESAARRITEEYHTPAYGLELSANSDESIDNVFKSIDKLGLRLYSFVHNAADLGRAMDPLTTEVSRFRKVVEINLVWAFALAQQAALRMKYGGRGYIVFIGSVDSRRAIPNKCAYCASKGGLNSLAKALALDLGKYGIRVNTLMPGAIHTDFWDRQPDDWKRMKEGRTPLNDIATYEDVANGAFYLGSDTASNITGAELVIDGGLDAQLSPI